MKKSDRVHVRLAAAWLLLAVAVFVANGYIYFTTLGHRGWHGLPTMLVLTFVGFGLPFIMFPRFTRARLRRYDLQCPHCGALFIGGPGRHTVATGICAHCHSPVISDHATEQT